MPLDVNTGYNDIFKAFADFATQSVNAGKSKAIARANGADGLAGRTIAAAKHDWVGIGVGRLSSLKDANNAARTMFRKAISDMFGGENNIPPEVLDAMKLADYGKGKPLTARRILAVKDAIDANGSAKARAEMIAKLETFESHEVEGAALGMGFTKAELPKLARAAHFYAQATGKSEMDAMKEVAQTGSDANRLMDYGGRFMQNAEDFAHGLRLIKDFADWFKDLGAANSILHKNNAAPADTPSKLSAGVGVLNGDSRKGYEKFVFEAFACDPNANLAETDKEKLFGFENNAASSFIGRDYARDVASTMAKIPPEKRSVVYASFDLFCRLATDANDAKVSNTRNRELLQGERTLFLARVLKNLDKLEALQAKGQLTARNLIKTCFPDMRDKTGYDLQALHRHFDAIDAELARPEEEGGKYMGLAGPINMMMETTGCTLEEADKALHGGAPIPPLDYVSAGQLPLEAFDGTTRGGRKTLEGDLVRPQNYSRLSDGVDLIPEGPDVGFGFTFPGERRFVANANPKWRDNIPKVGDKVEAMCGAVHVKQANAVMLMLSQSGLGPITKGLKGYGINSSEHSAVEYSLSRNEDTGDVTIKYESPKALPFRFEWTATVDIEGNVKSTPLKFEGPVEMNRNTARKLVADAARAMNVNLNGSQTGKAVALLQEFGTKMFAKNLNFFARFVVQMRLTDASAPKDRLHAEDMARSIREWRDVTAGDGQFAAFENTVRDYANDDLAVARGRPEKFDQNDPHIYSQIRTDANRGNYVVNGQAVPNMGSADKGNTLIAAIRRALPDGKAYKVATILMHQESLWRVKFPQMRGGFEFRTGDKKKVDFADMPGAEKIVNSNYMGGLYEVSIDNNTGIEYRLDAAPDGKTAKITISYDGKMLTGYGVNSQTEFGSYHIVEELTIDLEKDEPDVIDVKLSQTFSEEI